MATKTTGKQALANTVEQLIAGTNKHLTNTGPILLGGASYTPAQITDRLQALINLRDDVDAARATLRTKVVTEKTSLPALKTFANTFSTYVKTAYAGAPNILADFGVQPKTRALLNTEAKAAAAAKRNATRAARHTMGSKQKKAVKGSVTGVVVTPVLAASPATPSPSPTTTSPASGSASPPALASPPTPAAAVATVPTHAS